MKHVVLILCLAAGTASGQIEMKYDNGAIIQAIITADTMDAAMLYKAVDRWIVKTYKNPDRVVRARLDNEEIRGHGFEPEAMTILVSPKVTTDFAYDFKVEVKDGRLRFTMYSMMSDEYPLEYYTYKKDGTPKTTKQGELIKKGAIDIATELVKSLEESLRQPNKDDW